MEEYVMYVDASGDDGIKFDLGSSKCYAASAILMLKGDVAHNTAILSEIKHLMGAKPTDEVKYSRMRRHPKKKELHERLKGIKGFLYSNVLYKEHDPPSHIGAFAHTMALSTIAAHFKGLGDVHVEIVIDRMKQPEEEDVARLMRGYSGSHGKLPEYDIIFRDSKALGFELIQVADILAGLTRCYFEGVVNEGDAKPLFLLCQNCKTSVTVARRKSKSHRQLMQKVLSLFYFNTAHHLYRNATAMVPGWCLTIFPVRLGAQFQYIWC